MKKLSLLLVTVVAVYVVGQLTGWTTTMSWHQRLTIEVQTPDGMKSSHSVIKGIMHYSRSSWLPLEAQGVTYRYRGEAVVLELGQGRYLFALLKDMPNPFPVFLPGAAPVKAAYKLKNLRETRELSADQYPWLVTFDDIKDPESVRRVEPNRLDQHFGPGYMLTSIKLTITGEPVTKGRVYPILGWLGDYYNKHLDGSKIKHVKAKNRVANALGAGSFDTERN